MPGPATKNETKKLNDDQLKSKLRETRDELFGLRQKAVSEKVADSSVFKKKRAEIARTLTEMNARRLAKAPTKKVAKLTKAGRTAKLPATAPTASKPATK